MSVDISAAEKKILDVLPDVTVLAGEINAQGSYLIFDSIKVNESSIGDMDYRFNLFIAISSRTKNKRLAYQPVSDALSRLIEDFEKTQNIEVGTIKPYGAKSLIIYQIPLTVQGFESPDTSM